MKKKFGIDGMKKEAITLEVKKEIIKKHEEGMRVIDLAKQYNKSTSTICTILKNKEKIKSIDAAKGLTIILSTKQRPRVMEEVEKLLLVWIKEKQLAGESISEGIICKKAKLLHANLLKDVPSSSSDSTDFKASRGWFENFKRRTQIYSNSHHEEETNADKCTSEFKTLFHTEQYIPQEVFSCDETAMMENNISDLNRLCRICSSDLQGKGFGIFSTECMDKLIGEKIRRYLYFSVSLKDSLPKMVCATCLKKLENIHRFAKMAAEMQEKFRMLLTTKIEKPKIKIKSLDDINQEAAKKSEKALETQVENGKLRVENDENLEMNLDVAVEEVGNIEDIQIDEITSENKKNVDTSKVSETENLMVNGIGKLKGRSFSIEDENEADTSDSDRLVIQDEEKPNASLLHCLLVKGKQQMSSDMDHDYLVKIKEEPEVKEEPIDPEDEDIAEEIAEDRLNQIIKDEMDSVSELESEQEENSDIEITEMEVKVDPTLYFSNASQSGNEIEQDSQDGQDNLTIDCTYNSNSNSNASLSNRVLGVANDKNLDINKSQESNRFPVMTRLQQKMNPVIASLKLGKPYKCTLCPRSFTTDIGLQNHLWSHLPKARKSRNNGGVQTQLPKNIDLEDSQVYSSNGVLHTAQPSENPHLLKYVCPICGKKISTKGNLKVHLETHRPKGKYGCDICGRVFKTASNLFRHKDYHGGVQFPCPVCGRVYPTNSTLRAHSITHSDLRPHKCPLCSKTFKRNQDLKFHINQHTGARPYQCPYCPKAFASSGNCFSHRKRMHPLEVERDKERAAEIMEI